MKTELVIERNQFDEDQAEVSELEIKSNKGPQWQREQWNENTWERGTNNHQQKGRGVVKQKRERWDE